MRLALVDGTNAIMRRVMVQRELPVRQIVRGAALNIGDFVKFVDATHLLVAFDSKTSWRRNEAPEYKADRTVDTSPYSAALLNALAQLGVRCIGVKDYEADDVIATYATRLRERAEVVTLSSDTDLYALRTNQEKGNGVYTGVYKPKGGFKLLSYTDILEKFDVNSPLLIPLWQAFVGGKNGIPGQAGIGKKRASELLRESAHLNYEGIDVAELSRASRLLTLCDAAPVPTLSSSECKLPLSFGAIEEPINPNADATGAP